MGRFWQGATGGFANLEAAANIEAAANLEAAKGFALAKPYEVSCRFGSWLGDSETA